LTLQNLQYERLHLEREITATETFATIYQDIPLLSVSEFEAQAPTELKLLTPASDPHQMMLNRLTFELQERKRLAERVKSLQEKKTAIEKANKGLALDVTKLDSDIDALLTVRRASFLGWPL
jgi:THO complex subunit 5